MRYFVFSAFVALVILVLRSKPQPTSPADELPTSAAVVAASEHPGKGRPASQHDWAKSAIDRAQEVSAQVKRERASNSDVVR